MTFENESEVVWQIHKFLIELYDDYDDFDFE